MIIIIQDKASPSHNELMSNEDNTQLAFISLFCSVCGRVDYLWTPLDVGEFGCVLNCSYVKYLLVFVWMCMCMTCVCVACICVSIGVQSVFCILFINYLSPFLFLYNLLSMTTRTNVYRLFQRWSALESLLLSRGRCLSWSRIALYSSKAI